MLRCSAVPPPIDWLDQPMGGGGLLFYHLVSTGTPVGVKSGCSPLSLYKGAGLLCVADCKALSNLRQVASLEMYSVSGLNTTTHPSRNGLIAKPEGYRHSSFQLFIRRKHLPSDGDRRYLGGWEQIFSATLLVSVGDGQITCIQSGDGIHRFLF